MVSYHYKETFKLFIPFSDLFTKLRMAVGRPTIRNIKTRPIQLNPTIYVYGSLQKWFFIT